MNKDTTTVVYAVARGAKPGIYRTRQSFILIGLGNSVAPLSRAFGTHQEAKQWMRAHHLRPKHASAAMDLPRRVRGGLGSAARERAGSVHALAVAPGGVGPATTLILGDGSGRLLEVRALSPKAVALQLVVAALECVPDGPRPDGTRVIVAVPFPPGPTVALRYRDTMQRIYTLLAKRPGTTIETPADDDNDRAARDSLLSAANANRSDDTDTFVIVDESLLKE
jgi:hypothetical protein